jgi:hypothetical protein
MVPMHRMTLLAALLAVSAPAAHAAQDCTGTIGTALLHPLPAPLVVAAERQLEDTANPALSQRFAQGLQSAGVQIGKTGNVTISLSAEVTPPNPASAAPTAPARTYSNFDWMSGEGVTQGQHPALQGLQLTLSAQLTDNQTATISWLATISCTIQTNDAGALAEELGQEIGRTVGKGFLTEPL